MSARKGERKPKAPRISDREQALWRARDVLVNIINDEPFSTRDIERVLMCIDDALGIKPQEKSKDEAWGAEWRGPSTRQ
jgi:hypothetical protein